MTPRVFPRRSVRRTLALLSLVALMLFVGGAPASAQRRARLVADRPGVPVRPLRLNHRLGSPMGAATVTRPGGPALGVFQVIAIRVEFQPDTDPTTTGPGTFDLSTDAPDTTIGAAPHDARYFEAPLEFLRHYFATVSDGQMAIETTLLPTVYRLDRPMAAYSAETIADSTTLDLVRETLAKVTADPSAPDLSGYDPERTAVVLFHAGIGRDIATDNQVDDTPYDIPSITLTPAALGALASGDPTYRDGYDLRGLRVRNALILPETESRRIGFIDNSSGILELSLNGLLCASFGSFLGLPDLVNTDLGATGVGRFSLMDAQGLFSFNGLFPPEPDPWSKQFLGWITPELVAPSALARTLTLRSARSAGGATVVRIPLSATEYLLVENRQRDAHGDGVVLTVSRRDGSRETLRFETDRPGFQFGPFNTGAINGEVVEIDEPDWSLPGDTAQIGQRKVKPNGGILVWHVDEAVIARTIADNRINADPRRRGLFVLEADGAPDISGALGAAEGWALDYFFDGNLAPGYRNQLTPTSFPNTRTNDDRPSLVTLRGFSAPAPTMTVELISAPTVAFGRPAGLPLRLPTAPTAALALGGTGRFSLGGRIYRLYRSSDSTLAVSPVAGVSSVFKPAIGSGGEAFNIATTSLDSLTIIAQSSTPRLVERVPGGIRTAPVARSTDGNRSIVLVGTADGRVRQVRLMGVTLIEVTTGSPGPEPVGTITLGSGEQFVAVRADSVLVGRLLMDALDGVIEHRIAAPTGARWHATTAMTLTGTADGDVAVLADTRGRLHRLVIATATLSLLADLGAPLTAPLAGFYRDGETFVLAAEGRRLHAVAANGLEAPGFPVMLTDTLTVTPLVTAPRASDPGSPEPRTDDGLTLLALTRDGVLNGFRSDGRTAAGYPVAVGGSPPIGDPALVSPSGDSSPFADRWVVWATADDRGGLLDGVDLGAVSPVWGERYGDAHNRSSLSAVPVTADPGAAIFPSGSVYNWPNPVRTGGTETFIRYHLPAPGRVTVTIYDLSGVRVARLELAATGGTDEQIRWDVTGVRSGVYLARVEATLDGSGRSEQTVVKIGVLR